MTLLFVAIGLAIIYFLYRSNQATAAVAKKHQFPVPEDGITAIEYFWRPG